MKLIKQMIDLAFLWSLPYAALAFFWLLSLCQFSYKAAVTSDVFIVCVFVFALISSIIYGVSVGEEDEITLFNKTNK